jgi:hypothetical protein
MEITESTLNHLLNGLEVDVIHLFSMDSGMQIWFTNGAMLSVYARYSRVSEGEYLDINILGPEPPEKEQLREDWDLDVEEEE